LDQETVLRQFGILESRIEFLIDNCKRLESTKAELEHKNQQLTAQLENKIEAEKQFDELKGLVRSKLDSLMGRLDEYTGEQESIS
jgi:hypothetical protein